MADPNLHDFYGRLTRIEKSHRHGEGFEASGAIGRSYYSRQNRRRIPVFWPLVLMVCSVLGLKGVIHYSVGAATYDQRVSSLDAGEGIDKLGAYLMRADPATLFISDQIRDLLK